MASPLVLPSRVTRRSARSRRVAGALRAVVLGLALAVLVW